MWWWLAAATAWADPTSWCLSNGMRVAVSSVDDRPAVAVTLVVDVGAADDPVGKEGSAHLLEHLAFRSDDGGSVVGRYHAIGASYQGVTRAETTTYRAVGHASTLAPLVSTAAGILRDPLRGLSAADVRTEALVVRQERLMRSQYPWRMALHTALPYLGDPRYARLLPSDTASLDAIDLASLRGVAKGYTPDQASLVVTGAVTEDAVEAAIAEAWPGVSRTGDDCLGSRRTPSEPTTPGGELVERTGPVAEPVLLFGWSVPADADGRRLRPLAEGVLRRALSRSDLRRASEGCLGFDVGGSATVVCRVRDDPDARGRRIATVRDAAASIGRLAGAGERDAYVTSAQEWAATRRLTAADGRYDAMHDAEALAFHEHGRTTPEVTDADAAEVAAWARTWLDPDRMVTIALSRAPGAEPALAHGARAAGLTSAPEDPAVTAKLLQLGEIPVEQAQLANGMRVLVSPDPSASIVRAALVVHRGRIDEPMPGLHAFADRFSSLYLLTQPEMLAAWRRRSTSDQRRLMELGESWPDTLVSWISRRRHDHWSGIVAVPPSELQSALALLLRYTAPEARTRGATAWLAEQATARPEPDELTAEAWRWSQVVGAHPIQPQSDDYQASWSRFDVLDGVRWARGVLDPAHTTLVVTGPVSLAEVLDPTRQLYDNWRAATEERIAPRRFAASLPAAAPHELRTFEDEDGGRQAELGLSCPIGAATPETLVVVRSLVRGVARQLRESHGLTYGLDVGTVSLRGESGVLEVEGFVDEARATEAVTLLREGIERLATEGPSASLLGRARRAAAASYAQRALSTRGRLLRLIELSQPWWTGSSRARLEAVTPMDVQRALSPCIGRDAVSLEQ
jgi:zinc protease